MKPAFPPNSAANAFTLSAPNIASSSEPTANSGQLIFFLFADEARQVLVGGTDGRGDGCILGI